MSGGGITWYLEQARERSNARMIVIDPRYTDTAAGREDRRSCGFPPGYCRTSLPVYCFQYPRCCCRRCYRRSHAIPIPRPGAKMSGSRFVPVPMPRWSPVSPGYCRRVIAEHHYQFTVFNIRGAVAVVATVGIGHGAGDLGKRVRQRSGLY
jgi:hypothetical protein